MRWIVGILLIVAAILKAFELYVQPAAVLGDNFSRYLMPFLIGCEFGLGLAAVVGVYWRRLRLVAAVLFAGFAGYSLLLALQGVASCGCFGPLKVNPWWTFLLDVLVLTGLVFECLTQLNKKWTPLGPANLSPNIFGLGILVASSVLAGSLVWHVSPRADAFKVGFQTVGNLVILEPETWLGEPFPLLAHIDVDVSQGSWLLVLHRHDCPKCQEVLPKYEDLAITNPSKQIAIIEVPPLDALHEPLKSCCRVGQLSDDVDWFVQTPVEIALEEGIVTTVSTDVATASYN